MKNKLTCLLALLSLSLTGCKNHVLFATHSSLGLDVSGTEEIPNKVSFSYDRYEAAIVPRKSNGEAHSVLGGMDADVTWFHGHSIKQTFATGEAAALASHGDTNAFVSSTNASKAPLIFFTDTSYGLKISAGEDSTPANLLLGYRREEAAVIPTPDPAQEVRSVYADITISTTTSSSVTTNFSMLKGTRIKQSFATGKAAENLARQPEVQQKLAAAAGLQSIEEFSDKGASEKQISDKLKALPADKQLQLYQWADTTFPTESGGKLAEKNSADYFTDRFLPRLNAPQRDSVLTKINQL